MFLKQYQEKVIEKFSGELSNGYAKTKDTACFKIPTGGGKTIVAGYLIERFFLQEMNQRTGLVVWLVPTETIYTQTLKQLKNLNSPLRQVLERLSFGRVKVFTKNDVLLDTDIEKSLCLFVVINNSVVKEDKEGYKFYADNPKLLGNFYDFSKSTLVQQKAWYDQYSTVLDFIDESKVPASQRTYLPRLSLANTIKFHNPVVVVDEAHKFQGDNAQQCLKLLNPRFTIELSATPLEQQQENTLVEVPGVDLWRESMIKLPIQYDSINNTSVINGWKQLLDLAIDQLNTLSSIASNGVEEKYVRPIMLVRTNYIDESIKDKIINGEPSKTDKNGKVKPPKAPQPDAIFPSDVIEYLKKKGVDETSIRVKSSLVNEIKEEDLLSNESQVRVIITKDALKEGWDCPFAYILVNLVKPSAKSKGLITQLVGRVLRQPYTKKFKQAELNSCYVYYNEAEDGTDLYKQIASELKEEQGLDDIDNLVVSKKSGAVSPPKVGSKTKIKRNKAHTELDILLPKILSNGKEIEFYRDIYPSMSFNGFVLNKADIKEIQGVYQTALENPFHIFKQIGMGQSTAQSHNSAIAISDFEVISYLAEIVYNPFVAREMWFKIKKQLPTIEVVKEVMDFIIVKLQDYFEAEAQRVFEDKLNKGDFTFTAVCSGEHYQLPFEWETALEVETTTSKSFFDKQKKPNGAESKFCHEAETYFDGWYKYVEKEVASYYVKGWNKNYRVFPDFILLKGPSNKVYLVETKGAHLAKNKDTVYKTNLFAALNKASPKGSVNGAPIDIEFKLEIATGHHNIRGYKG